MPGGYNFTAMDKKEAIERELRRRRNVYARRVADNRMTQESADRRIAIMAEIAREYKTIADGERSRWRERLRTHMSQVDRRQPDPERVARMVARFDGLIKYAPMLMDHPDWSDDQCVAFAREQHAIAKARHDAGSKAWNERIPYCRNVYNNGVATGSDK